ncbi:ferric reductase like transmembrane component-domain-containing protein [Filobasidium floriforme]|uniref:ferric reductase like transmembrane component-domain-containing protein n=1 Tax=Filobasidium floriforme TaxID=5210 RepID=UPI001E8E88AB|nr:ferric reductase like transmembrane component-domain-containing protein [Filobasidium floriforme]KAH8083038.1 ferric reductase like transmembrane component-domain-containing protein [Filobasidium floriforme]
MVAGFIFPIILTLVSTVTAKRSVAALGESPYSCVEACKDALGLVTFGDTNPLAGYYAAQCTSKLFETSVAACANAYCSASRIRSGWQYSSDLCKDEGGVDLISYESALAAVPTNIATVSTLTSDVLTYNETILVDKEAWAAGFHTEDAWTSEMGYHHAFGWAMYVLLALIVITGLVFRLAGFVRARTLPQMVEQSPGLSTRIHTLWRKHISLPLFLHYRNQSKMGWFQVPRRLPALLVIAYMLINLVFVLICYDLFDDNLYWRHEIATQRWRYVADRTGIMAIYNLPILWLTASRNDLLLWICGWSYSDVQMFHRAIAFVATVLAIIHSGAYTWIERGYLKASWQEEYWYCGAIATICMSLMIPLSLRKFRGIAYEAFLVIHISLAVMTLVAMFYHVKIMEGEYNAYLWICVGLWSAERVIRIVRILVFSWKAMVGQNVKLTLGDGGNGIELLHLTVQTSLSYQPAPGTYYFLYLPTSWTPWENHPFTLAGVSTDLETRRTSLHFLAKVHRGATGRLARRVRKAGGEIMTKVWLEGPYGHSAPLERYHNVLMIAGGSGITTTLPYLQRLHALSSKNTGCNVRSIRLIWIVRTRAFADQVLAQYPAFFLPEHSVLSLDIQVYITEGGVDSGSAPELPFIDHRPPDENEQFFTEKKQEGTGSGDAKRDPEPSKTWGEITFYHGRRPQMQSVLDETLGQILHNGGRLGVTTCGPREMMDDMRAAVVFRYGIGKQDLWGSEVDLWEEQFTW